MRLPKEVVASRKRIAAKFLLGRGIEIGALDAPVPLPFRTRVRYVDRLTRAELIAEYPEHNQRRFVDVDVVDDGERLDRFADVSLDFIIANHMLEHCENPIGTIRRHLQKVAPGGWLFYALPDRRVTFDHRRALTTFDHLVADDADGGAGSRDEHYLEWAQLVNDIGDAAAAAEHARTISAQRYSIHFHVWDANSWLDFLVRVREYLGGAFAVHHFEFTGTEIICVLRRG